MPDTQFHGIRAASPIDALSLAASGEKLKEMQLLLDDGVDINGIAGYSKSTALYTAAEIGLIRSVEFLIEKGADLDKPGKFDTTPLMNACVLGKAKGSRVALRLIEAGANVNYVRKADEMTALKFAVKNCTPEVVQRLIDRGADVNGPPGTDQTALMIAAREDNVEALKVLVENGADLTLTCKLPWANNRTARGLAEMEKRRKAAVFLAALENS